jgi:hypothetical protein
MRIDLPMLSIVVRGALTLLLIGWHCPQPAIAGESEKHTARRDHLPQITRSQRTVEAWAVLVDERLLRPPGEAIGTPALRFLEARLAEIKVVVPKRPLEELQKVTIVLDQDHGRLTSMQYHPSADWLTDHGYAKELAKCVHLPRAADLATRRNINEQPWVILHELAHAYHDQVLSFDEPRIREAYRRFRESGHGDSVLLYNGQRIKHYALTDHKEFFAEMTEAFFGVNDFYPFNRAELQEAEPEIYTLLAEIWKDEETAAR